MIKIILWEDQYLDHAAKLFATVYSDETGIYPVEMAKSRIQSDLKDGLDYSFVALVDDQPLGEIICKRRWTEIGEELEIDSIQVDSTARNKGIARMLMAAVIDKAKQTGIEEIVFLADVSKTFPSGWYEELGFRKSHWVSFSGKVADLKCS